MNALEAVAAVSTQVSAAITPSLTSPVSPTTTPSNVGFGDLITRGIANVETKIDAAETLVQAFAIDDSVPIHQVTIALEEARMSVELAIEVRTRLVEAYREIMNTQL